MQTSENIVNGHARGTRRGAFEKILAYAGSKHSFAVHHYRRKGNGDSCRCAVGVLLSTRQINDIVRRDLNMTDINMVAEKIGRHNLEFVTGLSLGDLSKLQELNDNFGRKALLAHVKAELAKEVV